MHVFTPHSGALSTGVALGSQWSRECTLEPASLREEVGPCDGEDTVARHVQRLDSTDLQLR